MATTPRGCPSGRCHVHVKNLERGNGGTWRTGILDTKTVVTAQCMFDVVGNSANWDPGETFVTARCMSGVVPPIRFLMLTHGHWNTNQHQMSDSLADMHFGRGACPRGIPTSSARCSQSVAAAVIMADGQIAHARDERVYQFRWRKRQSAIPKLAE